jgi:hypothetical protein
VLEKRPERIEVGVEVDSLEGQRGDDGTREANGEIVYGDHRCYYVEATNPILGCEITGCPLPFKGGEWIFFFIVMNATHEV